MSMSQIDCPQCNSPDWVYDDQYDSTFCPICNIWLDPLVISGRPVKPSQRLAPCPMAGPCPSVFPVPFLEQPAEKEWTVILTCSGHNPIQVMKVIREITSLGIREVKSLVDTIPSELMAGIPKEEAENLKEKIEAVGGLCDLK